jgi:hypothetical protein
MPWWLLRFGSPFNETVRELYAVRPFWRTPVALDNTRLLQFLGEEPHTPLESAVLTSLRGLGALA